MKRFSRNILVCAENNGTNSGFNIYLVFSGQREYLLTHRHNSLIYRMLENGIRLPDMERGIRELDTQVLYGRRSRIVMTSQLVSNMRHLMAVIEEYIADREQCA